MLDQNRFSKVPQRDWILILSLTVILLLDLLEWSTLNTCKMKHGLLVAVTIKSKCFRLCPGEHLRDLEAVHVTKIFRKSSSTETWKLFNTSTLFYIAQTFLRSL